MDQKTFPAVFYRTAAGNEPVRHWLKAELEDEDRRRVGRDIKTAEIGWPLGMPLVRSLKAGIWEVRTELLGGRTARVLFCAHEQQMVLLHGFIKKTNKTPKADLDLARSRMKDIKSG